MNNRDIIQNRTLGDKLQFIEREMLLEDVIFARWLGLSVYDYSTSRYKYSKEKPTTAWRNLLFAIRHFGTSWLPYAQFEPASYEEIDEFKKNAILKRKEIDLFIVQPIVNRAYHEVIERLAEAILSYRETGDWTWDDTFCSIPELATSVCVRINGHKSPTKAREEDLINYDVQIMKMIRTLIDLFGIQIVRQNAK